MADTPYPVPVGFRFQRIHPALIPGNVLCAVSKILNR